jgi:hypothetical protein
MGIRFIKAIPPRTKAKATVHKTGKLGLNIEASKLMGIPDAKSFLFGADEDNMDKYYLLESDEEGSIKVAKAGDYYYLNAISVLDSIGIDYKKDWVAFDVSKEQYKGEDIYVLLRKENKKK